MRSHVIPQRILGLTLFMALAAAAAGLAAEDVSQLTGRLVFSGGSTTASEPFSLRIDRYSTGAERQRLAGLLAARHDFGPGDELWQDSVGSLSLDGGLSQRVAAVFAQDTSAGRTLYVVMNRQIYVTESAARPSRFAFSVLVLNLDKNGRGDGTLIDDASLTFHGDALEIQSREAQPYHLENVRAAH